MPDKARSRIQSMFGEIAGAYDLCNAAFSLGIDRWWRRFAARQALRPGDRAVLDVACGTGDLTAALRRAAPADCRVVGVDFCRPMLARASGKGDFPVVWGDGLRLPFPDGAFDAATIAFGLRNMEDTEAGLREMARVLRPGGRLAVLEFMLPPNPVVRWAYLLYFRHVLPAVGNLVSRSRAYSYLNDSVEKWPPPQALARILRSSGFPRVRWWTLSLGIAALHLAEKADDGRA